MVDEELEESIKKRFIGYSTSRLVKRMEDAEDFGYDDEEIELRRRLRKTNQDWKWNDSLSNPKIIIYTKEA